MEAKVKEEIPDKDYSQPTTTDRRKEVANTIDVRRRRIAERRRERRLFRGRCDPFRDYTDEEFIQTYRLGKEAVKSLSADLIPHLPRQQRRDGLTAMMKILIALAFYGSGSYQHVVGQNSHHNVAQVTVSRALRQVTNALNNPAVYRKYIKWPMLAADRNAIKAGFYRKFGIPGVIGCVDGTHVAIVRPVLQEERFYSRKGYHTLNVMIICDSNMRILCVDASSPGSAHDSVVWTQHPLSQWMDDLHANEDRVFLLASSGKELRSPELDDSRVSPTPGPPSPLNGSAEAHSPPLSEGSRSAAALQRLRRFLSAVQQFATDIGPEAGDRTRQIIYNLLSGTLNVEEFQASVQEVTNFPLRATVPAFLRALLPPAQRELHARARQAKQTPVQYIRSHEHLILESGGDSSDIFAPQPAEAGAKRRASDPFYEIPQTNGSHDACDFPPAPKRPLPSGLLVNPPLLYPLPGTGLFDYQPYPGCHQEGFDRSGISVRDVSSMNAPFSEPRLNPGLLKSDDEWRSINTMLNCILSMVEKTKRALAMLQQRGVEPSETTDIKRAASELMAAAVRQTEDRVADVRRRAEEAVNQVKRQALVELQRAVGAAETKALEIVAAERSKMERLLAERLQRHSPPASPPNSQQNCCWNCGRKAQETCSGCNAARYCGAFCQHKDWEHHHQVCAGRDQKPATANTSPPATTTIPKPLQPLPRATTPIAKLPITAPQIPERPITNENRLSLSSLNTAERMLSTNQERVVNNERIALASLSTAQGLIGGVGGKK